MAVGLAILLMAVMGRLHPPGGAIALGAALVGQETGFGYAIAPVGLCSLLLVIAAAIFARATGHSYPHRVPAPANPHDTRDVPPRSGSDSPQPTWTVPWPITVTCWT